MNIRFSLFRITFCLISLNTLIASGQNNIPFDFENGVWIENHFAYGEPNGIEYHNQYYSDGDTLINDLEYYKLKKYSRWVNFNVSPETHSSFDYIGAVRNINQSVEIIFSQESTPKILYDFNIDIGDTIKNGIGKDENIIIDAIDSILICGKFRRRYITSLENGFDNEEKQIIIEGIGFNSGLITPVLYPFEEWSELVCYTEKNNTNCDDCSLLLSNKKINADEKYTVQVIQDKNYIILKSNYQINNISIFGINGTVIQKLSTDKSYEAKVFKSQQIQDQKIIILKIEFLEDYAVRKLSVN